MTKFLAVVPFIVIVQALQHWMVSSSFFHDMDNRTILPGDVSTSRTDTTLSILPNTTMSDGTSVAHHNEIAQLLRMLPNRYIVMLKPNATGDLRVREIANKISSCYPGISIRSLMEGPVVFGFSLEMTTPIIQCLKLPCRPQPILNDQDNMLLMRQVELRLERLAQHPLVELIEQEQIFRVNDLVNELSPRNWGLDRIDQDALPLNQIYRYDSNNGGSGVTLYVLDTGIRSTHEDLEGRVTCGINTVDNDSSSCEDENGHGTHVAGIAAGTTFGVAKNAHLIAVKVLDKDGNGSTSSVIDGINYVARHSGPSVKRKVANLSLGGGFSQAMNEALRKAVDAGVFVAVAAGNSNQDACVESPSSATEAFTVAASDGYDRRAEFSNFGPCVNIFAPGVAIMSASYKDDTSVRVMSGTSMASPHAAGVAALYLARDPLASPNEIRHRILDDASAGYVSDALGSPNILLNSQSMLPLDHGSLDDEVASEVPTAAPSPDSCLLGCSSSSNNYAKLSFPSAIVSLLGFVIMSLLVCPGRIDG